MSQRFQVRASLVKGQPFYCRARRGWTADWKEIEVLDQDDDPVLPNPVKNLPDVPDPNKMGRRSFAQIAADSRIIVKPLDGATADAIKMPELEAKISELQLKCSLLQKDLDGAILRAKVAEELRDSKQARISELEELLSEATKPAAVETKPQGKKSQQAKG